MLKQNKTEHISGTDRRPAGRIKTFLAMLGGADPRIIAKVPETAFHFAEIAVVLIGTALIAGISMMFALVSGVGLPLSVAIPLAVVWALIILNLDRFLTSQMKSSRNIIKLLGAALPRVALAAIIGVIVAVPMTIRIFQTEVDAEVGRMRRAASAELSAKLDQGELAEALAKQKERISELRAQAAGGEQTGTVDPRVDAARQKMERVKADAEAKESEATQAELLYQCDRYGDEAARARLDDPSKCSPKAGPNGLAAQYERDAKQLRSQADDLAAQYEQARRELGDAEAASANASADTAAQRMAEAEEALPAALAEQDRLEALAREEADAARAEINAADGLLAQIEALNTLSRSPAMGAAHIAVALLFFVIELLPVIVKMFAAYGDPTPYEVAEEAERKQLISQARLDRERELGRIEGEVQRDLAIESDMLEREKALGIEANEYVQQQMQKVIAHSMQLWASEVDQGRRVARVATEPRGFSSQSASMGPARSEWTPEAGANGHAVPQPSASFWPGAAGLWDTGRPTGEPQHASTPVSQRWAAPVGAAYPAPREAGSQDGRTVMAPESDPYAVVSVSAPQQSSQPGGILRSGFQPMNPDSI